MARKLVLYKGDDKHPESVKSWLSRYGAEDVDKYEYKPDTYYFVQNRKVRYIPEYMLNMLKEYIDYTVMRPRKAIFS